ncbi:GNAT family N-acetyltransferase [Flavobacterium sp. RSB2_4_14]|uniref:GNAT family N-acetyltransferase n=1 Tax=Flavobacterium sp. RSB2_4_14 TaxID=3447665 RepID=UPI003F360502
MKNYTVRRYSSEHFELWNAFISTAKNATFLFHRHFMEYHADRFQDYSLLVFEDEKLVAVLSANKVNNVVYSHQGLTYGGLVLDKKAKLSSTIEVYKSVLKFLFENNIVKLSLKEIPSIYCNVFSDEVNYLSHICKSQLLMKHAVSVISLKQDVAISKSRRECINRGKKNNLIIKEETNFEVFWNQLLIPNLKEKYNAVPVHTAAEISLLQKRFPDNIRHFNVYHENELVCGTTVFITDKVVKPQYISGNENNNELGSLDFLYDFLINTFSKGKNYFDFGPSHENYGQNIVASINFWKESFGAKSVVQDFYEVETKNYELLENVLI